MKKGERERTHRLPVYSRNRSGTQEGEGCCCPPAGNGHCLHFPKESVISHETQEGWPDAFFGSLVARGRGSAGAF